MSTGNDTGHPEITKSQYRAAVTALGLDPDLVSSVTLSGTWVHIAEIEVMADGRPKIDLGQPTIRHHSGAVIDDSEVTE